MAEEKNQTTTSKKYYNLLGSLWARKTTQDTEGVIARVNKNNETVYELLFRSISGNLNDIQVKFNERFKADEIVITLQDVDELLTATVSLKSGYGEDLIKKLPNITKGNFYKLAGYEMESDRKNDKGEFYKNKGITCYDISGNKAPRYYTAATPHDFPQLPKNATAKDKTLYNDFDKIDFLKEIVKKWNGVSTPQSLNTNDAPASYTKTPATKYDEQPDELKDMPF